MMTKKLKPASSQVDATKKDVDKGKYVDVTPKYSEFSRAPRISTTMINNDSATELSYQTTHCNRKIKDSSPKKER